MEWVETTGKSVEEAKEKALDQLGVDETDAEFEVLEEPKPGLFGRMRGEARVRARVRPTRPRPKVDRRDRRRKAGDATKSADPAKDESPVPTPAADNGATSGSRPPVPKGKNRAGRTRKEPVVSEGEDVGVASVAPRTQAAENGNGASGPGAAAAEFLVGLAKAFGVGDASATVQLVADNDVEVRLEGSDLGLLIGPRGQTLQAIQDLTRLAVQRREDDRTARLRIDIAGYRERRRDALARFTEQVVAQVVASGEPRALEPMSAADRKVVHDVVNTIAGVTTRSEGEEPFRRVVIVPVDA